MKAVPVPVGVLVALAAGCGPRISSFAVTPARACAGDTVMVAFSARGTASLRVAPSRVGSSIDTTRYQLIVSKGGKTASASQDVLVYRQTDADTLVLGPTRRHGADSVRVVDNLESDLWPAFVVIGAITSASGRPIAVAHDGKVAIVGTGSAPTALDGSAVAGGWDLRAALLPGEEFAVAGRSPPDRLRLGVQIRCRPSLGASR